MLLICVLQDTLTAEHLLIVLTIKLNLFGCVRLAISQLDLIAWIGTSIISLQVLLNSLAEHGQA